MALFKSKVMRALDFHLNGYSFGIGVIEDRKVLEDGLVNLVAAAQKAARAGHREEVTRKLAEARTWTIAGPENKTQAWKMTIDTALKVVAKTQ